VMIAYAPMETTSMDIWDLLARGTHGS